MTILLFFLALGCFVCAIGILLIAQSAIHEIEALMLVIVSAIFFSASAILDA